MRRQSRDSRPGNTLPERYPHSRQGCRYGGLTVKSIVMIKIFISLLVVALFCCAGCSKNSGPVEPSRAVAQSSPRSQPAQPTQPVAGELKFTVPDGWTTEKPTSDMRFAQYKLQKAGSDTEDALLIVYYFGQGQGGSAQANIERWIGQIKQPDGSPSAEKAQIGKLTVHGLPVDTVDLKGNYSGGMSPDSAPQDTKAIYRLRGAVIETPRGSYFVKLTGPEKTVERWDQAYNNYLQSFEYR